MHDLAFIFAGFAVGLIVGLTGVGGGSLMTPLLIFFGVKPHLAIGTDLLFAAFTKLGGTVSMARQRLGACRTWGVESENRRFRQNRPQRDQFLPDLQPNSRAIGQKDGEKWAAAADLQPTIRKSDRLLVPWRVVGLLCAGSIPAALGSLWLLHHLPLPRIIAADIAYAVPLTLVAGLGHASLGSVDWPLLAQMLVGSLPGIWLGSRLISRTPERLIRSALSVLLAWAGAKLVLI